MTPAELGSIPAVGTLLGREVASTGDCEDDVYNVPMVRKQLYLEEAQDKALKRRAKELGVSEAEVVRRALDQALRPSEISAAQSRKRRTLQAFFEQADKRAESQPFPENYRFDRESLYEDDKRFRRWDRDE